MSAANAVGLTGELRLDLALISSPEYDILSRRVNNPDRGLLTGPYQLSDPVRDYIDFGPGRPV
jgi:hypothetical protein